MKWASSNIAGCVKLFCFSLIFYLLSCSWGTSPFCCTYIERRKQNWSLAASGSVIKFASTVTLTKCYFCTVCDVIFMLITRNPFCLYVLISSEPSALLFSVLIRFVLWHLFYCTVQHIMKTVHVSAGGCALWLSGSKRFSRRSGRSSPHRTRPLFHAATAKII